MCVSTPVPKVLSHKERYTRAPGFATRAPGIATNLQFLNAEKKRQGAGVCFRCLQPTKTHLSQSDIVLGRQNYVPAFLNCYQLLTSCLLLCFAVSG